MLQRSHIHRQISTFFHLSCEGVLHLVCLGVDVKQSGAGVVIEDAVLAKADVLVVSEGAQDAVSGPSQGLRLFNCEFTRDVAWSVHFIDFGGSPCCFDHIV